MVGEALLVWVCCKHRTV